MAARSEKIMFTGSQGDQLAARLDLPGGVPRATAIFAHCFTCSKDVFAASRIAGELTRLGFAVLRFDFTGLGMSGGEFANTNFSSNVADVIAAAAHMKQAGMPVDVLIGHSLGGAAVLAAALDIEEARAVVTIGAPADAKHVIHHFAASLDDVRNKGEAAVTIAGRQFTVKKQFLDDLEASSFHHRIAAMRKALLVFHAPTDNTVGLENAGEIFAVAKHPKSFIALDGADHLLSRRADAIYVAETISVWASRCIMQREEPVEEPLPEGYVRVAESGTGKYRQTVAVGKHKLVADEPVDAGGTDDGPSPYDYLSIALGACTTMTLRLYANHKKIPLERAEVLVRHEKKHMDDCKDCIDGKPMKTDHFERTLRLSGMLTDEDRQKLIAIADRCPVHQTLENRSHIVTKT